MGLEPKHSSAAGLTKGAKRHGPDKIKLFFSFFSKTWLNVGLVHWIFWNNILNIYFKHKFNSSDKIIQHYISSVETTFKKCWSRTPEGWNSTFLFKKRKSRKKTYIGSYFVEWSVNNIMAQNYLKRN